MIILAVESSCDETSVAILKDGKEVLSHIVYSQIDIHKEFGGVIPEISARDHIKKISLVFSRAIKEANIKAKDISLVAVTMGPGLIGSLIVGIVSASAFAIAHDIPIVGINHLMGHMYSAYLDNEIFYPAIFLLVSGGHTELIYVKDNNDFTLIGKTKDDAIGESYDKVARTLGLPYPGGPEIDKIAKSGDEKKYNFPRPLDIDGDFNFSYSGLKSAVLNKVNNLKQKKEKLDIPSLAASFQAAALEILLKKTKNALKKYKTKNLIIGGGVSANSRLRKYLKDDFNDYNIAIPKIKDATDNALMIAIAAYYQYKDLDLSKYKKYNIRPFSTKDLL